MRFMSRRPASSQSAVHPVAPAWRRAVPAAITTLALTSLALASCSAASSTSGDSAGTTYESGDFRVVEIPPDKRSEPVSFESTTERGAPVSSTDYRGRVYVVNFWYAACGPCIVEAPFLEEVWQEYQNDNVGFLGVNIYDQPATAISFAEENGVTYPSVIDVNNGTVKLAFAAVTPIQATPTTLVMDRSGRVAARVIGQLQSASILASLVDTVLAES